MTPERITAGLYRIKVPLPDSPLRYTNSYVIEAARPLVVDTGYGRPECREALLAGLAELELTPADTDLFLTHFHADHAGLAGLFSRAGSRVYLYPADGAWAKGIAEGSPAFSMDYYRRAGMSEAELAAIAATHPGYRYAAREKMEFCAIGPDFAFEARGRVFRAIPTPGHTPGHVCLLSGDGIFLCGDHVLFDITPNIVEWESMEDSLGTYMESLKAVLALPVKQAWPGHREPGDLARRVDELLEHHARRLEETLGIVQDAPGLSAYEIAGRLTWNIRARIWEEFPPAQRWFAVGEALAHLKHLAVRGKITARDEGGVRRYRAK